jgi:hypothetical protein
MNQKDLLAAKAAGETVAYSEYLDKSFAYEVRVLDTKAPRRAAGSGRYGLTPDNKTTGVQVQYVGGYNEGRTVTVPASQLYTTWAMHLAAVAAKESQEAAQARRTANSKLAAEQAAALVGARYLAATGNPVGYGQVEVKGNSYRNGNHYQPTTAYSVEVSSQVLLAILSPAAQAAS